MPQPGSNTGTSLLLFVPPDIELEHSLAALFLPGGSGYGVDCLQVPQSSGRKPRSQVTGVPGCPGWFRLCLTSCINAISHSQKCPGLTINYMVTLLFS